MNILCKIYFIRNIRSVVTKQLLDNEINVALILVYFSFFANVNS